MRSQSRRNRKHLCRWPAVCSSAAVITRSSFTSDKSFFLDAGLAFLMQRLCGRNLGLPKRRADLGPLRMVGCGTFIANGGVCSARGRTGTGLGSRQIHAAPAAPRRFALSSGYLGVHGLGEADSYGPPAAAHGPSDFLGHDRETMRCDQSPRGLTGRPLLKPPRTRRA